MPSTENIFLQVHYSIGLFVISLEPINDTFFPGINFKEFGFGVICVCTNILRYNSNLKIKGLYLKSHNFFYFLTFFDAILSAFSAPCSKISSINLLSLLSLFISLEIGSTLDTTNSANLFLKSEKFLFENSSIVWFQTDYLNLSKYCINF